MRDMVEKNTEELAVFVEEGADEDTVRYLKGRAHLNMCYDEDAKKEQTGLILKVDAGGLALADGDQMLRADFTSMLRRVSHGNLSGELLVKAAKIKGVSGALTAIDATAGLGEDAFLLAAAGFFVQLYEKDPVIALLLWDGIRRAKKDPALSAIADRMKFYERDSLMAMIQLNFQPDVILLDPMFPARQKSALIKKKFQLLQQLERPCSDEKALLDCAIACKPRKVIIKRPLKGPYLADQKPDYSLKGKAIRYDCFVFFRKK